MSEQAGGPLAPGRGPTMGDVAREAGVSRPLVSIVLRGAKGASDATRERVLRIADEMGYVPDDRARKLRQKSSRLLGVAFELQHPFHGDIVEQIYLAAEHRGYEVALSAVAPSRSERVAVGSLVKERCEAAIVLSLQPDADALQPYRDRIHLVTVGRTAEGLTAGVVRVDDAAGLRIAVLHLHGLGHRRIAHLDGGPSPGSRERRDGYEATMRELGLAEFLDVIPGGPTEEDGASGMTGLLGRPQLPTALIAFNDRCATGALDVALGSGLAVPGDLSIVGFDDSRLARTPRVQLTTVAQDAGELARAAVDLALEQAAGLPPREIVLEPQLVIRATARRPA